MKTVLSSVLGRSLAAVRPNSSVPSEVEASDLLRYMWDRGGLAVLRGAALFPRLRGGKLPLFVGRGAHVSFADRLTVGTGVSIGDYSKLNCYSTDGVVLGDRVTLREFGWMQLTSSIAHAGKLISIGNDTYIGPYWVLGAAAPIRIGSRCQFGARVSLIAEMHNIPDEGGIFGSGVSRAGITIGDDVWIGNGATILDGVEIGSGSVIGAGSVVTRSVPPKTVAAGVPCRVLRKLGDPSS